MAIVGLIPARGGSKGIPGKNIAPCAGRPLLAYTADAALQAKSLSRTILSTDDEAIARVGRELGLEVPFMRPAELGSDTASSLSVITHALDWLETHGTAVEAIVLLQPTSPFRTAAQIDEAVALFRETGAETVVSVVEVPHRFHPRALMDVKDGFLHSWKSNGEMVLRRQDMPVLYARNGPAILVLRPSQVRAGVLYGSRTVAYAMSAKDSLDVDTLDDLELAEFLFYRRRINTD